MASSPCNFNYINPASKPASESQFINNSSKLEAVPPI